MLFYLHGFASGPESAKGRMLADRFMPRRVRLLRPDLTPGEDGFERSTPSSMLAIVEGLLRVLPGRHALIGSSLGGYLAALAASRNPEVERVLLLAPAFRLAERWRSKLTPEALEAWKRDGFETLHHGSGRLRRIGHAFLEDADRLPAYPEVKVPALCIAGRRDEVVPLEDVERFVERTPGARLVVLDDGHELVASIERIWEEAWRFLAPTTAR